jgi:hypothetical protein
MPDVTYFIELNTGVRGINGDLGHKTQNPYIESYCVKSLIYTEDFYMFFTHDDVRLKALDKLVDKSNEMSVHSGKTGVFPLSVPFCSFHTEMQKSKSRKFNEITITKAKEPHKIAGSLSAILSRFGGEASIDVNIDGTVVKYDFMASNAGSLFHNWSNKRFTSGLSIQTQTNPRIFFQKDLFIALMILLGDKPKMTGDGFCNDDILYNVKTNEWNLHYGTEMMKPYPCMRPNMIQRIFELAKGKELIKIFG